MNVYGSEAPLQARLKLYVKRVLFDDEGLLLARFHSFWVAKNAALTMKHFLTSMIPLSYLNDGELFLINSDEV